MGSLSIWHWLIFLVVALLLFGGSGKISSIMGDVAKGIKSFKKGMTEDDTASAPDPFKKEEPKALDSAGQTGVGGAPTQGPTATQAPSPAPAPQVNKVG
jgi:sec-independent protein translocase protein TatA